MVPVTCLAVITSRILGIMSSSPRWNVVNQAVWFTPAQSNVPSSLASCSAVLCTLWHRPMTFMPIRSVAHTFADIGLA
jgi:hypothetical protein